MSNGDRDPVILSAVRTPIGKFQGSLSGIPAPNLGAIVIKASVEKAGIQNHLDKIDEVLMGNVVSAGLGQAPARQAAIFAGLPHSVGATTINKVCGSGLKTIMFAAQAIRAGDGGLFVCGGMENMSRAPYLIDGRTGGLRYGHQQLTDTLLHDGLWDPFMNWAIGEAGEFIADVYDIRREAMDDYAFQSHQKAMVAINSGKFQAEITPVEIPGKKGVPLIFEVDECPRPDTSFEALSRLKPAFKKDGRITPGNAPGLNDGAAALVIASREKAAKLGLTPIARILSQAQVAVEPKYLFDAPAQVIPMLLEKAHLTLDQIDLIELNEAFAAQVLANGAALRGQGWDWEKVNVNGGAIALGHPIGASGARVLTTLIHALRDRNLRFGLTCLCLGGAEAVAVVVEAE